MSQLALQDWACPGFCSMKRLGVFLLPPVWHASPSQGYPQHYVRRYPFIDLGGERHSESKVFCPRTLPTQCPQPRLFDLENSAVTMRLSCLHRNHVYCSDTLQYQVNDLIWLWNHGHLAVLGNSTWKYLIVPVLVCGKSGSFGLAVEMLAQPNTPILLKGTKKVHLGMNIILCKQIGLFKLMFASV